MPRLPTVVCAVALGLVWGGPSSAATVPQPPSDGPEALMHDDVLDLNETDVLRGDASTPGGRVPTRPVVRLQEFMNREACGALSAAEGYRWPCSDGRVVDHSDVCGTAPPILPLWEHHRASGTAPWSDWVMVADLTCGDDPAPSPELVLSEFRRLPITPSTLTVQPPGPVLVNIDTIAYVTPAPQTLTATVLGHRVTFTVTAASYTWDFGEGDPFTTSSPGHPYPDQDVAHPYAQPGTGQITVTTTWQATYTLDDDPTVRPVPGTAATTTTSTPFEILEAHSHLVANP